MSEQATISVTIPIEKDLLYELLNLATKREATLHAVMTVALTEYIDRTRSLSQSNKEEFIRYINRPASAEKP